MLAAAKADLEVQGAVLTKEPCSGNHPVFWHSDLRQQIIDKSLLARAQRFANASAVKPA